MRLLCGDQTITLVKHIKTDTGDSYTCYSMENASWFQKTSITTSGEGAKPVNTFTVRIPAEYFPTGIVPNNGDYIVKGVVTAVTKPSDLVNIDHFRITSVGDNNRGNIPHWRVDGQ